MSTPSNRRRCSAWSEVRCQERGTEKEGRYNTPSGTEKAGDFMTNVIRKTVSALLCFLVVFALAPLAATRTQAAQDAPVFILDSTTVDNEERVILRIRATNIPEVGLCSALVAVQFSRELKYVSCEFNSSLRGQRVAGTIDIDRGTYLERRFVWISSDTSAMYEDFVYVTCEFALPENLTEDKVYPIGLAVSSDPMYYIDPNGNALGASAVGGSVTVRDFDREFYLSALDSEVCGTDVAYMPVMLSGVESVRGGLASAHFTVSWDDRLKLVSLVPQDPAVKAQIALTDGASANVSWECGEDGPLDEGKLAFFASFMLPEDARNGDVYDISLTVPRDSGAFLSGQNVGVAERVVAESGALTVRGVNIDNRILGDVNGDGQIDARDILLIIRALTGWKVENYPGLAAYDAEMADVNKDGSVDAKDILDIMKIMLGVYPSPSAGPTLDTHVSINGFPAAYNEFLSSTVFVGDSICKGLSGYGYLPADNVVAENGAGAWSIFRYTFDVRGEKRGVTEALELLNPKNVVLFLGVNDTGASTAYFVNNYSNLIEKVRETLPDAKIYVASITPVSADCSYTTNERIDEFNLALRDLSYNMGCSFVNISGALKGPDNAILPEYCGSDGLHVPSSAYPVILGSLCSQIVD